jgi:hypothetical protein
MNRGEPDRKRRAVAQLSPCRGLLTMLSGLPIFRARSLNARERTEVVDALTG